MVPGKSVCVRGLKSKDATSSLSPSLLSLSISLCDTISRTERDRERVMEMRRETSWQRNRYVSQRETTFLSPLFSLSLSLSLSDINTLSPRSNGRSDRERDSSKTVLTPLSPSLSLSLSLSLSTPSLIVVVVLFSLCCAVTETERAAGEKDTAIISNTLDR